MTINTLSEVQMPQNEPEREQRISTFKATRVVWLLLSLFEAALALRFALKLIRAKPASPLAALLYGLTGFFRLKIFQF